MTDSSKPLACVWFRNDLRVHDNLCLTCAASLVANKQCSAVLPVFFFDPRSFGVTPFGNLKTGALRGQFQLESVLDLKHRLRALKSDLLVIVGQPEDHLPALLPPGSVVLAQEEVTSEELAVDRQVEGALKPRARLVREWGATLYHRDDLPFPATLATMPDVFTPFKEAVERKCTVRPLLPPVGVGCLPLPPNIDHLGFFPTFELLPYSSPVSPLSPDPRTAFPFKGGETEALRRLQYYLFDSDLVAKYFETRNGMLGADYSTKFSPWMAFGCLSPRKVFHEIKAYEKKRVANKSTYWVVFEMIWRDFFRFFAIKHGNTIFHPSGPARQRRQWSSNADHLRRWKEGRTGLPLVDANMRELAATGWMSNRGRQNVASYLALDLQLDWREGADYFESLLVDYDVCSNWGNWVAAAGLTGGRLNRFNIAKQSKDYDSDGAYVRCWILELAKVPSRRIHEPHLMSAAEQKEFGVQIGVDYPAPPSLKELPKGLGRAEGGQGYGGRKGGKGGSGQGRPPDGATLRSGGPGWGRPY
eukprot:EG_transcript_7094